MTYPKLGFAFSFVLLSALVLLAQEFQGKLETELRPDMTHVYERLYSPSKSGVTVKFSPVLDAGSSVTQGLLIDQRVPDGKTPVMLVDPPSDVPFVAVDINANGVIELAERFMMKVSAVNPSVFSTVIQLPITHPLFKTFPIFFTHQRGYKHPQLAATDRVIAQSVYGLAFGMVPIEGRNVLFQYPFDPQSPTISTTEDYLAWTRTTTV